MRLTRNSVDQSSEGVRRNLIEALYVLNQQDRGQPISRHKPHAKHDDSRKLAADSHQDRHLTGRIGLGQDGQWPLGWLLV